ncbi:DUF6059 family protein [Streptomyces sp. KR55]|uniref:DUF6059 family protein n=1 Tax=Streptomyces sp. KR55 TaxID=3457425 RepID=UPI003FD4BBB9
MPDREREADGESPSGGPGEDEGESQGYFAALSRGVVVCGTWLLTTVYEGLKAAGLMWVHPPPPDIPAAQPESPAPLLDAPPDGHPERLSSHVPLSPDEIDIWARFYTDP